MKRTFITLVAAVAIGFSACNETVAEYDKTLPAVQPATTGTLPADSLNKTVGVESLPPVAAPATAPAKSATALNPEHGKPGHRCDIAVGAPLNSTPATVPVVGPAASPAKAPSVPALPATLGGGAVTINPPHGQPGHDCAIPVGEPLKS